MAERRRRDCGWEDDGTRPRNMTGIGKAVHRTVTGGLGRWLVMVT